MSGFSKVLVIGNLVRDPELRYTQSSGKAVMDICLAISSGRSQPQQGPKGAQAPQDSSDSVFIDVTLWDRQAEFVSEYFSKGKPILVEGRLTQDRWQDKDGQNRSKIKILAERVQFLPRDKEGPAGASTGRGATSYEDEERYPPSRRPAAPPPPRQQTRRYPEEDDYDQPPARRQRPQEEEESTGMRGGERGERRAPQPSRSRPQPPPRNEPRDDFDDMDVGGAPEDGDDVPF